MGLWHYAGGTSRRPSIGYSTPGGRHCGLVWLRARPHAHPHCCRVGTIPLRQICWRHSYDERSAHDRDERVRARPSAAEFCLPERHCFQRVRAACLFRVDSAECEIGVTRQHWQPSNSESEPEPASEDHAVQLWRLRLPVPVLARLQLELSFCRAATGIRRPHLIAGAVTVGRFWMQHCQPEPHWHWQSRCQWQCPASPSRRVPGRVSAWHRRLASGLP